MSELQLAERAELAVKTFTEWRFRYRKSDRVDAVYVATYSRPTNGGDWQYGQFLILPGTAFESFRRQFPTAQFLEVGPGETVVS